MTTPRWLTRAMQLLPTRARTWLVLLRRVTGMTPRDQILLWMSAVIDTVLPSTEETPSPRWDLWVRARTTGVLFHVRRQTDDLYHALPRREADVESAVLEGLLPGDVVIDIGANIGFYTLHAAKAVGPEGRVIAIEGQPETFHILVANIDLNDATNVEVVPAVVTDRTGDVASFTVQRRRFGTATPRAVDVHTADPAIPTVTLDDATHDVTRVQVLKLDIEGGELSALRGARHLLGRVDRVVVECNKDAEEILVLLRSHGFAVERLHFTAHYVAWRNGVHDDS